MKSRNQIKSGVILSYILLLANTVYGLLVSPYVLQYVGESSYGVYKSIASLSSSLAVMDLGLGSTMTRYMAKFHATKDKEGASNFASMMFLQYVILSLIIIVVSGVAYGAVPLIYKSSFTSLEIRLARILLLIMVFNMVLRLLENLFSGIATGHECFTLSNGVKLVSVVFKFSLIFVLMPIVKNILLMVLLESVIVIAAIIILAIYINKKIGLRPRLKKWDMPLFKESFRYSLLTFFQTLALQFNGNVDNVLIGSIVGPESVTIYSMSLLIFTMYENLSGSIASIMLPNMTKRVLSGQTPQQLQSGVEKAGRFQFVILGAALGGFIVLGKDFYDLWLGNAFSDCYYLTLILIIPVTFTMVQNVSLSVLRAQNRMGYRTITLVISCIFNCIVTVIGLNLWGYWGAALGTAFSTLSNIFFMNIYYHRHLHFRVFRMFINIFKRTIWCMTAAAMVTFFTHRYLQSTWTSFFINVIVFMMVYIGLLFVWGLSTDEKETLLGRFARRKV